MRTKLEVLREIESELKRFSKKLSLAIEEQKRPDTPCHSKIYASAKRSALDLKNELTKLTQDSIYRYL